MSNQRWWLIGIGCLLLIAGVWGYRLWSRPPVVTVENLKYISLLRTAVSAQDPVRVEKVHAALKGLHAAGELSRTELAHFERLIALATAKQWEAANRACFDFEAAQMSRWRAASDHAAGHAH